MKKFGTLLLMFVITLSSCMKEDLDDIRSRLSKLEEWQKSVNSEITTLKALVEAVEGKDFVTGVKPLADGSGYTISFTNSGDITIKHGANGNDGATPVIGTKIHTDGKYYWTINDEWMLDSSENKLPVTGENGADGEDGADAIAPQMRIHPNTNMWEVSTDGGTTWTSTGVEATGANGGDGDSFFQSVDDRNPNFVVITLTDGTILKLPKMPKVTVGFDSYEVFTFSFDNMLKQENFINLNFPTTLKKSEFTAMSATLKHSNGETTDIVTRAVEPTKTNWGINFVEPTFKTDGTIDMDYLSYVELIPPTDPYSVKDGETFLLEVSLINVEGQISTVTRPVIINYRVIEIDGAGSLDYRFQEGNYSKYLLKAPDIVIKGEINYADFHALKDIIAQGVLFHLDLSEAIVVGKIDTYYDTDAKEWISQEGNAIPASAFNYRTNDTAGNLTLKSIVLPNTVTTIGEGAFQYCQALKSVKLGNALKTVCNSVFYGNIAMTSIEFPSTVRTLGRWMFQGCTNLATITLNEGVETIPASAFYGASGLTEFTVPNSVTIIEGFAFTHCTSLKNITIPSTVTSLGEEMFWGCTSLVEATINSPITVLPKNFFYETTALKKVTLPNELNTIDECAFQLSGLEEFVIPSTVTAIHNNAFSPCYNLTKITIAGAVDVMGVGVFAECTELTTVIIAEGLTTIGDATFLRCRKLNNVVLPSTITQIRDRAFNTCSGLTSLTCNAVTAPNLDPMDNGTNHYSHFNSISAQCVLSVPAGSDYSAWDKYFSSIVTK